MAAPARPSRASDLAAATATASTSAPPGPWGRPPPRQIAVALCHVRLPAAGGHVSRPRRASDPLLGNIRDTSRNCQHDMSRNCRLGRLTACPAACLCRCRGHPRGRRRRFAALNRGRASSRLRRQHRRSCRRGWAAGFRLTGARHGRGRRDLRSRCPAAARGCRPRRACRSRWGTRHWSRPAGRRRPPRLRFAVMTTRTPWVSAPGRSGSGRLTAGKVRNSLCSVAAGSVRRHPDYEDLVAHRPQARALQGRRDCEPGPAAVVLAAGASRAGPRRGGCLPAQDRGSRAGPCQSSAGCQSTGGGSEPCLMMLAYTLSSASLSGPTRPSGSPSKTRRRTRSTCPGAASC